MRVKLFVAWAMAILPIAAWAGEEVAAVMTIRQTDYFIIHDTSAATISPWLKLGDKFKGRRLTGYDREGGLLELQGPSGTQTLHLATAHVAAAPMADNHPDPFQLLAGSAEVRDGKIVYSPDAILKDKGCLLRAIEGSLESDASRPDLVRGAMVFASEKTMIVAEHGTYDASTGHVTLTSFGMNHNFRAHAAKAR